MRQPAHTIERYIFNFAKGLKEFDLLGWGVRDPFRDIRSDATGLAFFSVDDFMHSTNGTYCGVHTGSWNHGTVRDGRLFGYLRLLICCRSCQCRPHAGPHRSLNSFDQTCHSRVNAKPDTPGVFLLSLPQLCKD
jgi:hypothetical protein